MSPQAVRAAGPGWVMAILVTAAVVGFHAVQNGIWLALDRVLPFDDSAFHLSAALACRDLIIHFSWNAIPMLFNQMVMNFYPPFFHICMGLAGWLGGESDAVACMANMPFLALMVLSLYGIGRKIRRPGAGLFAGCLLSLYPFVFGLSKMPLPDFALAAMVIASLWCLLETDRFTRRASSMLLGILLGLGMLTKQVYVLFMGPPFLFAVTEAFWMSRKKSRSVWLARVDNIKWLILVVLLIAFSWYVPRFFELLQSHEHTLQEGIRLGPVESDGAGWLGYYAWHLARSQVLPVFTLVFITGFVGLFFHKVQHRWLWVAALAGPYLVMSLLSVKEPKQSVPILPVVALVSSLGIWAIRKIWLRYSMAAFLLLFGLLQYHVVAYCSVPEPPAWRREIFTRIIRSSVLWTIFPVPIDPIIGMTHAFSTVGWNLNAVVDWIEAERPREQIVTVLTSYRYHMRTQEEERAPRENAIATNGFAIQYACRRRGFACQIRSGGKEVPVNWRWGAADWQNHPMRDWPELAVMTRAIDEFVPREVSSHYTLVRELYAGDHSRVFLYRREGLGGG